MAKERVTVIIENGEVQEVYCNNDNITVRVIYLDQEMIETEFIRRDEQKENNKQIN